MNDCCFGIDFGTTNSACVAILEGRKEIKIGDGYENPFPSIVAVDKLSGKEAFCGREVWVRRQELSQTCKIFTSVKNNLGTDWKETIQNIDWVPEMIAAKILGSLQLQAREQAGIKKLEHAVVAVPAGFSPEKRKSLRIAARAVGIQIDSFISEPTAALFCHISEIGSYSKIGVIDWGGGTFDVSIIKLGSSDNGHKIVKELGVGGLNLGGDDIDLRIAEWAHNQIINIKGTRTAFDEMPAEARDQLIARCERAKRALAFDDIAPIRLNRYGDLGAVNIPLDIEILTSLTAGYVADAVKCFEETLGRSRLSIEDLGCILMVGGSVNIEPFSEAADKRWSCAKYYPADSDWSVAKGAALLAMNSGQYRIASDIGVAMSDDTFFPIIKSGEKLDNRKKHFTFGLVEDSDTASFIFADSYGNMLGHLDVPAFGFFREKIVLEIFIDENLVFRADARSSNHGEEYANSWLYSGMAFDYELPVVK